MNVETKQNTNAIVQFKNFSGVNGNKKLTEEDSQNDVETTRYSIGKMIDTNKSCLTLKDLIDGLYEIFESDHINVEQVHALMSSYKSNPAEWLKYAKFDKYRYTRNLVDAGNDKFNLMVLCWGEGHGSSIHDHADAHCFMKMLAGNLCEIRYEWPQDESSINDEENTQNCSRGMKEKGRSILHTDQVCYINDSIGLHRVENLSYTDRAVSLHLYCPPFEECKIFDLHTGRSTKSRVTFWSIFGERNKDKSLVHQIEDN